MLVYAVGIDGDSRFTIERHVPAATARIPLPFPFPGSGRAWPRRPRRQPRPRISGSAGGPRGSIAARRSRQRAALRETDRRQRRPDRDRRDVARSRSGDDEHRRRVEPAGTSSATRRPAKKDGRWHTIRVEVRDGRYTVRARRGYVAS